jgi:putative phosphoribosyl transferase
VKIFHSPPFEDRREAGRKLAAKLSRFRGGGCVVFGLPRGGVPVGYEISRSLGAPLDVFVSRKLGAPGQPEFGIGAVAAGGVRILNTDVIRRLGIPDEYVDRITAQEIAEVNRRLRFFRGGRPEMEVGGRTAILVDDGLATGVTARAAVEAMKLRKPERLILAAPVCAAQTTSVFASKVDELLCLASPSDLGAIGLWYRNFDQTTDEEVVQLLEKARDERRATGRS